MHLEYYQKTTLHPVRIYFETPTLEKYKKDSKSTFVSKISTIGGIMGFWNGFCLMCYAEIVYFVALAIIKCFGYQDDDQEVPDSVSGDWKYFPLDVLSTY